MLDNAHSDEIAAFLAVAAQGSFVAAGRFLERLLEGLQQFCPDPVS